MNLDPYLTVPPLLTEAAMAINAYFAEQGIDSWEFMGMCSRKRVSELEEQISELEDQLSRAKNRPPVTLQLPVPPEDSASRDERAWLACEDKLAEALFRLAHEIRDSRKSSDALLKFLQDNFGAATKKDLEELGKKIMSQISEFADKVDVWVKTIGDGADSIVESLGKIDTDIQSLKKLIKEFQDSPGAVTPEDQARLNKLEEVIGALAVKSAAAATQAKALDEQTETAPTA